MAMEALGMVTVVLEMAVETLVEPLRPDRGPDLALVEVAVEAEVEAVKQTSLCAPLPWTQLNVARSVLMV